LIKKASLNFFEFSATPRHEIDSQQLRENLLAVVEETMQPAHVSLWLRSVEPASKHNAEQA
jgi:hypothetical protein